MSLHDYQCSACDTILRDVVRSIALGALAAPPRCPLCLIPMEWIPQVGAMDTYEPFQEFSQQVEVRGQHVPVQIDSLHKLRQVERESEQRASNGEGAPLVWRDYAQNRTNRDVHAILPHHQAPRPTSKKVSVRRHGRAEPSVSTAAIPVESPLKG